MHLLLLTLALFGSSFATSYDEGQTMYFACPNGKIEHITGTYGTRNRYPVDQQLQQLCLGRDSCSVGCTNNVFGDPVPNVRKSCETSHSCSNSAGSSCDASRSTLEASITADNFLHQVIIGGNKHFPPIDTHWDWTKSVTVSSTGDYIAVEAQNALWGGNDSPAGLLASIKLNGQTVEGTGGHWLCTDVKPVPDGFGRQWFDRDFEAINWEPAHIRGNHGDGPWGKIPGIGNDAKWIWTERSGNKHSIRVWCRSQLYCGESDIEQPLEIPLDIPQEGPYRPSGYVGNSGGGGYSYSSATEAEASAEQAQTAAEQTQVTSVDGRADTNIFGNEQDDGRTIAVAALALGVVALLVTGALLLVIVIRK
jgi:hypothetical protein